MKTLTKTTATLFAALLISLNVFATGIEFEEENYIDDIPFNLEEVKQQVTYEEALTVEFLLNEEEYVDDIPSSILDSVSHKLYTEAVSQKFNFEEEEYINDIPLSLTPETISEVFAVVR